MSPFLLALLLVAPAPARSPDWGPRDWPPPAPGVYAGPPRRPPTPGLVPKLYRWYHEHVSSKDGAVCPYYPTCSLYALRSFQEHGYLVGALLTIDRLLREYPWMGRYDHYPVVTPYGTPRFYDPPPPARHRRRNDEPEER